MTYKVYDVAGSYTDTTNGQDYIYASGVNLTSGAAGADIFTDAAGTITATANSIYVFVGSQDSQGSITLNGAADRVYAASGTNLTVVANGINDQVFGASNASSFFYFLEGTNDSFFGSTGVNFVSVGGTNDSVSLGNSLGSVTVDFTTALSATIDAGGGTLNLNDYVGDNGMLTMDVGKNMVSNANGLTIANVGNLDYTIASPGSSTRRTASTKFTVESGTNNFDFSYSSGSNTVYNTGSGTTVVSGGSGTDLVVGGAGYTRLQTEGGTDALYGGTGQTDFLSGAGAGTSRFWGGSGHDNFDGSAGSGSEYMYGAGGADFFQAGNGTNVLVEGSGSDNFRGSSGTDYVYGGSSNSSVFGGAGTDYVYTGASNQDFVSGAGKEYMYEEASNLTNGRLDTVDNFQAQSAGGKGTFIFEPTADANKTTFVASGTGTYIVNPAVNMAGGTADVFVPNVAPSLVKAQTYFNL